MLSCSRLQKAARGLRNQHGAPIAGKQQDAVLQVAENLVEIFLQRGEDLFHIAHALADHLDLGGDARRHVLPLAQAFFVLAGTAPAAVQ